MIYFNKEDGQISIKYLEEKFKKFLDEMYSSDYNYHLTMYNTKVNDENEVVQFSFQKERGEQNAN